ncbi:MAG: MipA/OmpV family protein [Bdellovibrionales bacterium]|nr:MipA/OmpV family protein [Bdellovibrionales bacterium]
MHFKWGALLLPLLLATNTYAQLSDVQGESPLWELGMGGAVIAAPDYPSSDHNNLWLLPFPWGVYRGEILHSDRRGATRARLFRSASYEFNVSAGGGLPSSAHANGVREGMPDLEWLGEAGPRLMIDLWGEEQGGRFVRLGIPLRMAISTNLRRFTDRGYLFMPELLYDHPHIFGSEFDVFASVTVEFSDKRFANYFYGVHPDYATPERPRYDARSGYVETDLTIGFMYPFGNSGLRVFTMGSVQSLDGSANEKSPLFKTRLNTSASVVLLWVFAESSVNVRSED